MAKRKFTPAQRRAVNEECSIAYRAGFDSGKAIGKQETEAKYRVAELEDRRLQQTEKLINHFGQALDAMAHAVRATLAPGSF